MLDSILIQVRRYVAELRRRGDVGLLRLEFHLVHVALQMLGSGAAELCHIVYVFIVEDSTQVDIVTIGS